MGNIVKIDHFYYQDLLEDCSFSVEKNKFITVSGPNNCGKTTLIRILDRQIIVDDGILVNNRNINIYPIEYYASFCSCIIPFEHIPDANTIEEEMKLNDLNETAIKEIIKGLKLTRNKNKKIETLTRKQFILYQLAISLSKNPKLLLIDNISPYFDESEIKEIILFLRKFQQNRDLTIIYTTLNLKESLYTDYLYILGDKKVILEGKPIEVLQKDNIINKTGLNLPFMVDLSVKLRDYDLIENIELDLDRMVDTLWK